MKRNTAKAEIGGGVRRRSGSRDMTSLSHAGVELSRDDFACSRPRKISASFWRRTALALLAIAAIELGIWAGLEVSARPTRSTTSVLYWIGEASSRSAKEVEAEARPQFGCLSGIVESDGKVFAVFSERLGHQQVETASGVGSDAGSADVFDQNGRLVRHYTAIEHADDSWELRELMRVTPDSAGCP